LNPGSPQANPAVLSALPLALHSGIVQAFADSLHDVLAAILGMDEASETMAAT
jgi:hypothetical protein